MRITKQMIRRIVREQAEDAAERPEDVEAVEDAWAGGDNLVHDVDYSKVSGGEPNVAEPEVLDIVVAEVRRRVQERMQAHARPGDLKQPWPEETEFPVVVGYTINGQSQSEIAYDDEELTQILDYLAPLSGRGKQIPYSIDSLSDVEAADVPVGSAIEQYMEGKDQNKDGKNDFEDVKIARMRASGMSDAEIKKKHPELFEESLRIRRLRQAINEYGSYGSPRGGYGPVTVKDIERMLPAGVMRDYSGAARILQRRALDAGMSKNDLEGKIKAARIKDNEHPRQFFRRLGFKYDLSESKMEATKNQLRRIIKEETSRLNERGTGNPALAAEERALTTAVVNWVDKYRMVMGMDPNDFGDDRRIKRILDDMIGALIQ